MVIRTATHGHLPNTEQEWQYKMNLYFYYGEPGHVNSVTRKGKIMTRITIMWIKIVKLLN